MNERSTTKLLSEFYKTKQLPPESVARLRQLAAPASDMDDTPVSQNNRMLRLAPLLSAAAAFLLTITIVLLYERGHRPLSTLFKTAAQEPAEVNHPEVLPAADIIVLNFHADCDGIRCTIGGWSDNWPGSTEATGIDESRTDSGEQIGPSPGPPSLEDREARLLYEVFRFRLRIRQGDGVSIRLMKQ